MKYLTVEVAIDQGRIVALEPNKLPFKGHGFLTVLEEGGDTSLTTMAELPKAGLCGNRRTRPRPVGLAKGEFVVPDDFNAPLPDQVIGDFESK